MSFSFFLAFQDFFLSLSGSVSLSLSLSSCLGYGRLHLHLSKHSPVHCAGSDSLIFSVDRRLHTAEIPPGSLAHTIMPASCMFLLTCNKAGSSLCGDTHPPPFTRTQRHRGFFQPLLRVHLLARESLHDLVFEAQRAKTNCQLASRPVFSHQTFPLLAVQPRLVPFVVLQIVTVLPQADCAQLAVLFHHHCCDVPVIESFFPTSFITLEPGFTPSRRTAHRTGHKGSTRPHSHPRPRPCPAACAARTPACPRTPSERQPSSSVGPASTSCRTLLPKRSSLVQTNPELTWAASPPHLRSCDTVLRFNPTLHVSKFLHPSSYAFLLTSVSLLNSAFASDTSLSTVVSFSSRIKTSLTNFY